MTNADKDLPQKSSKSAIDAFVEKVRATPVIKSGQERGRLMFAMDATGSREPSWDRACQIQGEMFDATASLGGLSVQLAYYRGFGEFRPATENKPGKKGTSENRRVEIFVVPSGV